MRFIIANEFYQQMLQMPDHTPDCYVRPGEYLHHMYIDGVKYVDRPGRPRLPRRGRGARATRRRSPTCGCTSCTTRRCSPTPSGPATSRGRDAPRRPAADRRGGAPGHRQRRTPRASPTRWEDLGLDLPFLFDLILRTIYTRGQITGGELASEMAVPFAVLNPVFQAMRKQSLIDIVGQRGNSGDASFVYEIKPPKGDRRPAGRAGQDELRRPRPGPVRRLRRVRCWPRRSRSWSSPGGASARRSRTWSSPTRCSTRSARRSTRPSRSSSSATPATARRASPSGSPG